VRLKLTTLILVTAGTGFTHAFCTTAGGIEVTTTQNTDRLMPYQVFQLAFQHPNDYRDPTWDVSIEVRFHSPAHKKHTVGGFFYGSSKPQRPEILDLGSRRGPIAVWPCRPADLWKARFAPDELGTWEFEYVFRTPGGEKSIGRGRFEVVSGRVPSKGFVRINPDNPFRFVFDDGSPYFPIGFQDGIFDNNHNGSVMDAHAIEGPFRPDPEGRRPVPPPGALFARGPSMGPMTGDFTLRTHARAGFNLWRFSPNNFSIKVFADPEDPNRPTLEHVRWEQARMVDELLGMTRKYGMRNFYGIFGFTPAFNHEPDNQEGMTKVKRIVKYSVDRWGAYVDFWELLNEQRADARWIDAVAAYLKSIDPYHHPVATSWERPELPAIDVNAPHWYGNEDELASDLVTVGRAQRQKKFAKPVVYGEQGNYRGKEDQSARGIGGVWDPGSARRMRVRSWTALFNEIVFIFWETSYAKDGHVRNLWIGPEERQYLRALQDFAGALDGGVRMVKVPLAGPQAGDVRSYGLRSDRCVAVYLHHGACRQCAEASLRSGRPEHDWNHDRGEVADLEVAIDIPKPAKGYWYRPADGHVLGTFDAAAGRRSVAAPAFVIDLALLVSDQGPPDRDGDGLANHADEDDDNDGVPDAEDAWPLDPDQWADVDGDRIGDNLDADVNADGVADDLNHNGVPDNEEPDWDGDGVPNAAAIPWDAFPRDRDEWQDTDGDGLGDNADTDDDGDGYSDREEAEAGTDPLDPIHFPIEGETHHAGDNNRVLEMAAQRVSSGPGRSRRAVAGRAGSRRAGGAASIATGDPNPACH